MTLRLPAGQRVHAASGADFSHDGAVVSFTPRAANRQVSPGDTVEFSFDVVTLLAARPDRCTIDGRPCD